MGQLIKILKEIQIQGNINPEDVVSLYKEKIGEPGLANIDKSRKVHKIINTEFGGDQLDYFDTYENLIRKLDKNNLYKLYIKLKNLELNEIQIKQPEKWKMFKEGDKVQWKAPSKRKGTIGNINIYDNRVVFHIFINKQKGSHTYLTYYNYPSKDYELESNKIFDTLTKINLNEIQIKSPDLVDSFLKVGEKYYIQDKPGSYKAKVTYKGKTIENERTDGTGEEFIVYNFLYDVPWIFSYEEMVDKIKNKLITKVKK